MKKLVEWFEEKMEEKKEREAATEKRREEMERLAENLSSEIVEVANHMEQKKMHEATIRFTNNFFLGITIEYERAERGLVEQMIYKISKNCNFNAPDIYAENQYELQTGILNNYSEEELSALSEIDPSDYKLLEAD